VRQEIKSSIDELNDMTFQFRKHDENKETVKTMKKQVRALVTECNSLIQEVETSLKTDNTRYKMNKKRRNEEINSVNIMVVKEQHNDSTFQSQAFLSKTNDEATFILDTGCKGTHLQRSCTTRHKTRKTNCGDYEVINGQITTSTTGTLPIKGKHLHAVLIPLRNKTIGNIFILFAFDEKSGYCSGVPISKKQTTNIVEAFKILLSEYSSSGHKVQRVTTDDEKALNDVKPRWQTRH
jgi:hypothetical protein